MKIRDYIQDELRNRLAAADCLVLYDPDGRYRNLALELADARCAVVDAGDSLIRGREQAMAAWLALGAAGPGERQLLVRLPWARPLTDEDRQQDPFQAFALGGAVFPAGPADAYLDLCQKAKPELRERLHALFEADPVPSFETVDALDGGATWPQLRTLLGVESAREVLVGLLAPSPAQQTALTGDTAWIGEYRDFVARVLGLQAHAGLRHWTDLRDELARFVLFSEMALDLPGALPPALADLPRAGEAQRSLIYDVCEHLRDARTRREQYMALADRVSRQLELPVRMASVQALGRRDTFLFEERAYLRRCAEAAAAGDLDAARTIVSERRGSVWAESEDRGPAWVIADRALALMDAVATLAADPALNGQGARAGLAALIELYADRARRADALHRDFEATVHDAYGQTDGLEPLIETARQRHRTFSDDLQRRFIAAVTAEGWPIAGFTRQTRVFDEHLAPALERNRRVALFMVDALRYELAAELAARLPDAMSATLAPALGQMPSITSVGMAALLPGADGRLRLTADKDDLVPTIDGQRIGTPDERVAHLRARYGDRVQDLPLDKLLKSGRGRPGIAATVDLLLVKCTDIDNAGENLSVAALGIMRGVLEKLLRALTVLQGLGFEQAVIAADHGFVLLGEQLPGDKVARPAGDWPLAKVRCLAGRSGLGAGASPDGVVCFRKEDLGVRGDLEDLAVPASLGAFTTGATFMHSGLSLQECVIPVLRVELGGGAAAAGDAPAVRLQLQYRGGGTDRITTQRPMIEVVLFQQDMFGGETLRFLLEARAGGKVVGSVAPSPNVDPATGLVTIAAGAAVKVPLRMAEDFQGGFTVTAVDPTTHLTYASLKLSTDYVD